MSADLTARLGSYIARFDEAAILLGLNPLAARIEKQFTNGRASQFDENLFHFCIDYLHSVPNQINHIRSASVDLGLVELVDTYCTLASNFLISACDELEQSQQSLKLEEFLILLQGAYIYSRMQEELDDKIQAFVGVPLSHINLMEANLIVHEILGDSFANRLDKVVVSLIQQSKVSMKVIEANLDSLLVEAAKSNNQSLTGMKIEDFSAKHGFGMLNALT